MAEFKQLSLDVEVHQALEELKPLLDRKYKADIVRYLALAELKRQKR